MAVVLAERNGLGRFLNAFRSGKKAPENPINPLDETAVRPDVAKASRLAGGIIFEQDISDYRTKKVRHLVENYGHSHFSATSMTKMTPERKIAQELVNESNTKLRELGLASEYPKRT